MQVYEFLALSVPTVLILLLVFQSIKEDVSKSKNFAFAIFGFLFMLVYVAIAWIPFGFGTWDIIYYPFASEKLNLVRAIIWALLALVHYAMCLAFIVNNRIDSIISIFIVWLILNGSSFILTAIAEFAISFFV